MSPVSLRSRIGSRLASCVAGFVLMISSPAVAGPGPICAGDCDDNGVVTVEEVVRAVDVLLEVLSVSTCEASDVDQTGSITIDEVVAALSNSLTGCPPP